MIDKSTYQVKYNDPSTGLFKDNITKDIGADDARDNVQDIAESVPFTADDSYTWASPLIAVTGTTTLTGTASPVITAYVHGQSFKVKTASSATGFLTLNLNSVGAKKIYKNPVTQAYIGDWRVNSIYELVYDSTLDSASGGFLMVTGNIDTLDKVGVATDPGPDITFDFQYKKKRLFVGIDPITGPRNILITNVDNAIELDFILNIQDASAILTFESNVGMADVRWEATGTDEWEPDALGYFTGHGLFDGSTWFITISPNVYS